MPLTERGKLTFRRMLRSIETLDGCVWTVVRKLKTPVRTLQNLRPHLQNLHPHVQNLRAHLQDLCQHVHVPH